MLYLLAAQLLLEGAAGEFELSALFLFNPSTSLVNIKVHGEVETELSLPRVHGTIFFSMAESKTEEAGRPEEGKTNGQHLSQEMQAMSGSYYSC